MINSVSGTSSVSRLYLQQQQPNTPTNRTKPVEKSEKQDSVVLSKEAVAAAQASHHGGERH
jgi:hypothetical protein